MKIIEGTLPVQKGSELNDRLLKIQGLYQKLNNYGVLNALQEKVGVHIRPIVLSKIDGVNTWRQPLYKSTPDQEKSIIDSFNNGSWIGNMAIPPYDNNEWSDDLRIDMIRRGLQTDPNVSDEDTYAKLTFNVNGELFFQKGSYCYTTRLNKNVPRNLQKLFSVFEYAFQERSIIAPDEASG